MRLFLLGQIVGLPTLHSILTRFGITSNNAQIKYQQLCRCLSHSNLHEMFEFVFEQQLSAALEQLSRKDASTWSRELVTAVLDDSVFKQWLQSQDPAQAWEHCYGRFFSGQVGHPVFGFQVVTFGLSLEGVFYPLYFACVKKPAAGAKQAKPSVQVAQKLVVKWGRFVARLAQQGISLPTLHFSCDSGYSDVALSGTCADNGLNYISVPQKKHNFVIASAKMNLNEWLEKVFLPAEADHLAAEKELPKEAQTPFTLRFRAFYSSQEREVTLLAFRLQGSKKVSIIYAPDKNIKGKTLRRHWFQRTYIEQFFKLLKHSLKIQQTITRTKHLFEVKLLRFAFVALHIQLLVRSARRQCRGWQQRGFGFLRTLLQSDPDLLGHLQQML